MRVAYLPSNPDKYNGLQSISALDRRRLAALMPYWAESGIEMIPWTPSVSCDIVYIVSLPLALCFAERIFSPKRKYAVVGGIIEDPFYGYYADWPTNDINILRQNASARFSGIRGMARQIKRGVSRMGFSLDQTINLFRAIQQCDGIVTTSEGQATMVRQLNLKTISITDPIPETDIGGHRCNYKQSEPLSIAWEGTAWGLHLVELIRPALESVYRNCRFKVEFVFIGPQKRPDDLHGLRNNEEILKKYYNMPTRWVDWKLETIGRTLSDASIGIAPMPVNNPFYRNKAFSKPLSYMACGLPVVASPIPSYKEIIQEGVNGFLAESESEWINALLCLLESSEKREEIGQAGLKVTDLHSCRIAAVEFSKFFQNSYQLFKCKQ